MTPADHTTIIVALISVILGGGLFQGISSIWKSRQEAKKVPIDLNSISIGSAERALVMLQTLLDEAQEKIAELKTERAELIAAHKEQMDEKNHQHREEMNEKNHRIHELEIEVRELTDKVNEAWENLARALKQPTGE